jgi:hypothetical protein
MIAPGSDDDADGDDRDSSDRGDDRERPRC